MMKLASTGRGTQYTPLRGMVESLQHLLYAGGWPSRLLDLWEAACRVQVARHALPVLPATLTRPLRVAFASDLHIGPLTPPTLLRNAFRLLAEAEPDVLVLGGDYVSLEVTARGVRELEALVAAVPAPVKVAVLGNHDLWTRHELIEGALAAGGACVLVNGAVHLPAPHAGVAIVGLDEPWTGAADGDVAFAAAGQAKCIIAVAHSPDGYPMVRGRGARLLLCGHTHGGQIALPGGPVVVPGRHGRRWPSGLHQVEDLHLFVSRGLGVVDLPLRAFAPPDIGLLTLLPGG